MKSRIVAVLAGALILFPGVLLAQTHRGGSMHGGGGMMGSGQYMMGPGMQHNLGMMSGMMREMHQMMGYGNWTPAQQREMLQMMNQMGTLMQQMGGPQNPQMQMQHRQQLERMQRRLNNLKSQMKGR
ncbi:MAG: hypothetical protein P8168_13270 [Deltaproteobacteria bacterium]|jgi:TolA-binding protein